jgi:hypothetical protein
MDIKTPDLPKPLALCVADFGDKWGRGAILLDIQTGYPFSSKDFNSKIFPAMTSIRQGCSLDNEEAEMEIDQYGLEVKLPKTVAS